MYSYSTCKHRLLAEFASSFIYYKTQNQQRRKFVHHHHPKRNPRETIWSLSGLAASPLYMRYASHNALANDIIKSSKLVIMFVLGNSQTSAMATRRLLASLGYHPALREHRARNWRGMRSCSLWRTVDAWWFDHDFGVNLPCGGAGLCGWCNGMKGYGEKRKCMWNGNALIFFCIFGDIFFA